MRAVSGRALGRATEPTFRLWQRGARRFGSFASALGHLGKNRQGNAMSVWLLGAVVAKSRNVATADDVPHATVFHVRRPLLHLCLVYSRFNHQKQRTRNNGTGEEH